MTATGSANVPTALSDKLQAGSIQHGAELMAALAELKGSAGLKGILGGTGMAPLVRPRSPRMRLFGSTRFGGPVSVALYPLPTREFQEASFIVSRRLILASPCGESMTLKWSRVFCIEAAKPCCHPPKALLPRFTHPAVRG